LVKWQSSAPAGFFRSEAVGLKSLAETKTVRTPQVYGVSEAGIVMEWLDQVSGAEWEMGGRLGEEVAALHRVSRESFGFDEDNYVGAMPQVNRPTAGWTDFYRRFRLQPQFEEARRLGRLGPERSRLAERLMERLPEWIDDAEAEPSLLHGDLWGGNWLAAAGGPALLDPAVYYGDREMDLAMARLFGGFPESFFAAYEASFPLRPGWRERLPLYQLYYLLVHLNLFGESYGPQVDRILRRYAG